LDSSLVKLQPLVQRLLEPTDFLPQLGDFGIAALLVPFLISCPEFVFSRIVASGSPASRLSRLLVPSLSKLNFDKPSQLLA
jgi:hypothetical protein